MHTKHYNKLNLIKHAEACNIKNKKEEFYAEP